MKVDVSLVDGRLDKWLQQQHPDLTRTVLQTFIKDGYVTVDGSVVKKPAFDLSKSTTVSYELRIEEKESGIVPTPMELDIVYEDEALIVVNKPRGLLVHPTDQSSELTLVHGLLAHCGSLADGEGENRPGIVHRLDRFTEGVLVVAKTNDAFTQLKEQFKERQVEKRYYAMLKGALSEDEYHLTTMMGRHRVHRQKQTSRSPVPGTEKEAISIVSVKKRFNTKTFCDIQILTGRTHQIRVHCAELGHPVIGDSLYDVNSGKKYDGQLLQCYYLQFKHPESLKVCEFKVDSSPIFS